MTIEMRPVSIVDGDDDEDREQDVGGIELERLFEMRERKPPSGVVKAAASEKPSG